MIDPEPVLLKRDVSRTGMFIEKGRAWLARAPLDGHFDLPVRSFWRFSRKKLAQRSTPPATPDATRRRDGSRVPPDHPARRPPVPDSLARPEVLRPAMPPAGLRLLHRHSAPAKSPASRAC